VGGVAAPASASLPIVTVKGGYDARPAIGWERNLSERSRASSFPDKPTGTDTICRNDSGESSPEENGRENGCWEKSICGAASVGVSIVGLNGVTVSCVPWFVDSLKNEDPTDVRLRLCLRRHHATSAMVPTASKATTPPMTPPVTARVCDVGVSVELTSRTGTLRKISRSLEEETSCHKRTVELMAHTLRLLRD
jgi:hypothetical protein